MRKLLLFLAFILLPSIASAQQGLKATAFTSAVADAGIKNSGSAISFHKLTWNKTGTVTGCTVALDSSVDGITWSAGAAIAGQTCTSNGVSAIANVTANYVRMNMTAFVGTGEVTVTWTGFVSDPTPGGTGTVTNAAPLTANLPVIGAGGNAVAVGTRTGNTTQFPTWTGATTAAKCVDTDASGNLQVTAADCGAAVGTVTTSGAPVANQTAYFTGAAVITGTTTDTTVTHSLFATAGAPAYRQATLADVFAGVSPNGTFDFSAVTIFKVPSITSSTANPATTGCWLCMAKTDKILIRNNVNGANLNVAQLNSSDQVVLGDSAGVVMGSGSQGILDIPFAAAPGNPAAGLNRLFSTSTDVGCLTPAGASCLPQLSGANTWTGNQIFKSGDPLLDLRSYGAVGDGATVADAVTNGTTTLTSATASFLQSRDAGKLIICVGCGTAGANLITTIASVSNATTIILTVAATNTASGLTIYWGTNDTTNIASAVTAACGKWLLVPNGIFLNDGRNVITCANGMHVVGNGYGSQIAGDPGNFPFFETNAGAVGIEFTGIRFANIHTNTGTDSNYQAVYFNPCISCSVHDNWFTAGRLGVVAFHVNSWILIHHNWFIGMKDGAVSVLGDGLGAVSSFVEVSDNLISASVTTGQNGPPHDISFEDVTDGLIAHNMISNGTGFTEAGASCIQVFANAASIARVKVVGNSCVRTTVGTHPGFVTGVSGALTYTDMELSGNTYTGYSTGEEWGSAWTANKLINVKSCGNTYNNSQVHGVHISGTSGGVAEGLQFCDLTIRGPGNIGAGGFYGMFVIGVNGLQISNINVSNTANTGIELQGVANGQYSNLTVTGSGLGGSGSGIVCENWTTGPTTCSNNHFANINSYGSTQTYGLLLQTSSTGNTVVGLHRVVNFTATYLDSGTGNYVEPVRLNTNVTPVTVNANVSTAQNLMAFSVPAKIANGIGTSLHLKGYGVYTLGAITPTVTISVNLGALTLCTWVSGAATISVANNQFEFECTATTTTAGASGALEAHGTMSINLGSLTSSAESLYGDTNTATVSTVALTSTQTLQITITFSIANASNAATQRMMVTEQL